MTLKNVTLVFNLPTFFSSTIYDFLVIIVKIYLTVMRIWQTKKKLANFKIYLLRLKSLIVIRFVRKFNEKY